MKKPAILLIILILACDLAFSQTITIEGKVLDMTDKSIIPNCVISLKPDNRIATSGRNGRYMFTCSPGRKEISTRMLGYKPAEISFELTSDTTINIYLEALPVEVGEVKVVADSLRNMEVTSRGSYVITPVAVNEYPRVFSEPDLMKSIQLMPGVVPGKDGSSDIYVRGGGKGQNVILANGCYFFLPSHLLGFVSPFDLNFLESAELYKDYFPAEMGGGASSVLNLSFREPRTDTLTAQLRLGLLTSGMTVELPLDNINMDITAGIRRGNYSLYSSLLKKIVSTEVAENLPPDDYSFYDGYLQLVHTSSRLGNIKYLFFGNYDNSREEYEETGLAGDTLTHYMEGMATGWNSMVHAIQWHLPEKNRLKWRFDLNYNRMAMKRELYSQTEKLITTSDSMIGTSEISYSILPTVDNLGSAIMVDGTKGALGYSAGLSGRIRFFSPNILAYSSVNDTVTENIYGEDHVVFEPAAFISASVSLTGLQINAGLRLSGIFTGDTKYFIPEPRLRLAYKPGGIISLHINYVRLSQTDHSVEGSNAGLRTMLWLPVSREFGPEISNVYSAGFQGNINNDIIWSLDVYYKNISGMVDFHPGASFIFDTSFEELLDRIGGRAYGAEAGIIKKKGRLTGNISYTYSRAEREWSSPEGMIWIPSAADRPHNVNIAAKYRLNERLSFGLNWVFVSGSPATIYMHETSYGEWFETKNNIRYFDYHRLDLSCRYVIPMKRLSVMIAADVYNVYNRKNTYYFRRTYDESEQVYYFKNISLFPVMPSVSVTIKY